MWTLVIPWGPPATSWRGQRSSDCMGLLLLLSCFSCVRLCVTPQMAAHQAPPSLGFSRQEHWSGLPFPSPMHESEKWKGSRSAVSDSRDPMDCSPPASSIHGIFQARVLEWGTIAFSGHLSRGNSKSYLGAAGKRCSLSLSYYQVESGMTPIPCKAHPKCEEISAAVRPTPGFCKYMR